jgi:hypothetical protein
MPLLEGALAKPNRDSCRIVLQFDVLFLIIEVAFIELKYLVIKHLYIRFLLCPFLAQY